MPARLIEIAKLQPTDTLRPEVINPLRSLNAKEIDSIGEKQVWETPIGLLISEGNNRTALIARAGGMYGLFDYLNMFSVPEYLQEIYNGVIEKANQLRHKGIYTVHDLWQA